MDTYIVVAPGGRIEKHTNPRNEDIKSEIVSLGRGQEEAKKFIEELQKMRYKHGFYLPEFCKSFSEKVIFYKECYALIKKYNLPLNIGRIRDQCIMRLIGPYFRYYKKQYYLKIKGRNLLPPITISKREIFSIMESYEISISFIKNIYRIDDMYIIEDENYTTYTPQQENNLLFISDNQLTGNLKLAFI